MPLPARPAGRAIRTGTRCTTLVKLPVAFSAGSSENTEPEAGASDSTVPLIGSPSIGVDVDRHLLAGHQLGELRLLEIGVDIERSVGTSAASRHPGDTRSPCLHREIADHAVIGRLEHGEAQVAIGLVERELLAT